MAEKLKDYYNAEYLEELADRIGAVCEAFDRALFREETAGAIGNLEFNDRQELIARALRTSIPLSYEETIQVFSKILGAELRGNSGAFSEGWRLWPIGKFVELYGDEYFDISIAFSKELTKRFTSEFCMRPLIRKDPEKALAILTEWSTDRHERVRRLSSECLRIRLPWAKKLYTALEYFDRYAKILTNLKDDGDKYIQKSVANNLNDLYKEAPEKFYALIEEWQRGEVGKECAWVIKHGSRNVGKEKK